MSRTRKLGFLTGLRFQNQLSLVFSIGMILLALVTALVISEAATYMLRERILKEAESLANSLTRQAVLPLLYQSEDIAEEVGNVFVGFPDVRGVDLVLKDFTVLHSQGEIDPIEYSQHLWLPGLRLVRETDAEWVFAATVQVESAAASLPREDSVFIALDDENIESDTEVETETVGYAALHMGKDSLNKVSREIFWYSLGISLGAAIFLLMVLLFITGRLNRPLTRLSRTMRLATEGDSAQRAQAFGPRDVRDMIHDFNVMMDGLEQREQELKQARDAAESSALAKARFAANVSHELRTPMNGVLGMLELLPDFGLTETQAEYVGIARKSAQSLLTLIDDILDFSKIESKEIHIQRETFTLETLLEDVISLLGGKAQARKLDFYYVFEEGVPRSVLGDEEKIKQVLINLVGNALKFTERGEVYIRVSLEFEGDEFSVLKFCVVDSGVGVSEEARTRIFDAFSQADNSTTRRFGGTGLGLAISRQLVLAMEGDIDVSSTPGIGSEFWFTLPLQRGEDIPLDSFNQNNKPRTLVVHPNVRFSQSVEQAVERFCETVTLARTVFDAVRAIEVASTQGEPFNAVFLDADSEDYHLLLEKLPRISDVDNTKIITLVNRAVASQVDHAGLVNLQLSKPLTSKRLQIALFEVFPHLSRRIQERPKLKTSMRSTPLHHYPDKSVLVCEDNETNWLVAQRMLEGLGCRVAVVHNGKDAVSAVKNEAFDLILMDCHMPIMDGYEATQKIRAWMRESNREIPIVAMTANSAKGERERCLEAGMVDYLPKPLNRKEFNRTLSRWFEGAPASSNSVEENPAKTTACGEAPPTALAEAKADSPVELEAASEDLAVIDSQVFGELQEMIGDGIGAVVESFVAQIDEQLGALQLAIESAQSDQVRLFSHSIKGSASNFGAERLVEASRDLEHCAKSNDLEDAASRFTRIQTESEAVLSFLAPYRDHA